MIKIQQAVIVEGKYDKIKLSSIIDAVIIETNGFKIFKDKEKQNLIRKLAEKNGILIITDSDTAGFKIRSFVCGAVNTGNIYHAYIPDMLGKEKRKSLPSKEGTLGVEGIPPKMIIEALSKAGIIYENSIIKSKCITETDFYEDGISGRKNSRILKASFLKHVGLPSRLSTSSLLKIVNIFMSFDDYKSAVTACKIQKED